MDIVYRADDYKGFYNKNCMAGPSQLRLLDEMMMKFPVKRGGRLLDLGCREGITSTFLAKEAGGLVFAVDDIISVNGNNIRFERWGVSKNAIPLRAKADELPFADKYFDSIVSVGFFHKTSKDPDFFRKYLLRLLKPGGTALLVMPGLKEECPPTLPPELERWAELNAGEFDHYHCPDWWEEKLSAGIGRENVRAFEMDNFYLAWQQWFDSGHPASLVEKELFEAGAERYLCFVGAFIKAN